MNPHIFTLMPEAPWPYMRIKEATNLLQVDRKMLVGLAVSHQVHGRLRAVRLATAKGNYIIVLNKDDVLTLLSDIALSKEKR